MYFCIISISSVKHILLLNLQMSHGNSHGNPLKPQSSSQVLCILAFHPWHQAQLWTSGLSLPSDTPTPVPPLCLHLQNVLLPCNFQIPAPDSPFLSRQFSRTTLWHKGLPPLSWPGQCCATMAGWYSFRGEQAIIYMLSKRPTTWFGYMLSAQKRSMLLDL